TVVLMLAVAGLGWVLGIQPALDTTFAAEEQRDEVQSQNDALRAELVALEAARDDLPALERDLAELTASIPFTDDSSALIDSIHDLARVAGVEVAGVVVEDAQVYVPPQAAATSAASSTS